MRREFFDSCRERIKELKAGFPPQGTRFSCPCCGYPTLSKRGYYHICRLCNWEDDGQDFAEADWTSAVNHGYTLTEAQSNFEQYLVMYPPENDRRAFRDSEKEIELKRALIAAFEQMMISPSAKKLKALWREVRRIEKALYKELKRKIREYEAGAGGK